MNDDVARDVAHGGLARGLRLDVARVNRAAFAAVPARARVLTDIVEHVTLVGIVESDELSTAVTTQVAPKIVALNADSRRWEPSAEAPAVVLVRRPGLGDYLRPAERLTEHVGAGGNYAASTDSRLTRVLAQGFYGALPVHDHYPFASE